MNTLITRKVFEPGGFAYLLCDGKCDPLPPDVSYIISNYHGHRELVTWGEVMDIRRKRQSQIMANIRSEVEPAVLPCYVWTFFNPQSIPYYGWYCYVMTRHGDIGVNFRGFHNELAISIMRAIPLGFLPSPIVFDEWMEAFAGAFPRAVHVRDHRKAGSKIGWLHNRETFTIERPK